MCLDLYFVPGRIRSGQRDRSNVMREKIWYWIAKRLPRSLVMWCGYRMAAYATTGKYSHEEVPGIDMMTMFDRWIRG